ncbi:MAG TPA: nitroreductase family protein [Burkholderiales bacterium]|nr:nitroreductase family protein [Burkholderiales bacterium]
MSPENAHKAAAADHPILDLIQNRWSPRAFDANTPVLDSDVHIMLEAARWAPSSNNAQPWRYVYGRRGSAGFDRIRATLKESNVIWAENAGVLAIVAARLTFDDGRLNPHAEYDTGQSVAFLVLQGTALGLWLHQMAGFDAGKAVETLGIPEGFVPLTAVAVGHRTDHLTLPTDRLRERELAPRKRRPIPNIAAEGTWSAALNM